MLNQNEIEQLITKDNLIENFIDLKTQLTPNGFDLSVAKIFEYDCQGVLDFSNAQRVIPKCKEIEAKDAWWELKKGAYKIQINEKVNFPKDLIGIAFTRSSLLRMGAFAQNGVWDAGFSGKSEFMLIVENPFGIKLKKDTRVIQLLFERISPVTEGYRGIYQEQK